MNAIYNSVIINKRIYIYINMNQFILSALIIDAKFLLLIVYDITTKIKSLISYSLL